jgi:hypothetical protein
LKPSVCASIGIDSHRRPTHCRPRHGARLLPAANAMMK